MTDPCAAAPVEPHRPALVVSAALLGDALQLSDGFYGLAPIALVTVALALAWLALTAPRALNAVLPDRDRAVAQVILAVVVMQLLLIGAAPIGFYFRRPMPWQHPGFVPGLVVAGLGTLAATLAGPRRWLRLAAAAAVVAAATWLGVLTYRGSPSPAIDVVPVHHDAFAALGRGESPYSMTFADIYAGTEQFYPPGMAVDGRVLYGFPYPPLSLAMAWPGHLAGDFRYAELAALVAAAAFAIAAGRASAVAIARRRRPAVHAARPSSRSSRPGPSRSPSSGSPARSGPRPPAGRWRRRRSSGWRSPPSSTWRWPCRPPGCSAPIALPAGARSPSPCGVAGIALLPALADLPGFLHSAVMVQVREVLRMDSLSLAVTWAERTGAPMPGAAYAALVVAAAGLAVLARPGDAVGVGRRAGGHALHRLRLRQEGVLQLLRDGAGGVGAGDRRQEERSIRPA